VEPITKTEYEQKSKRLPPSLFAHNVMQHSMHTVHAQDKNSKGILGRVMNVIGQGSNPMSGGLYSLSGNVRMLEGSRPPSMIDKTHGILRYTAVGSTGADIGNLTAPKFTSVFGETFADLINKTLLESEDLGQMLETTTTTEEFGSDDMSKQLHQVARLLKLRQFRGSDRDVFFTQINGFDTHNDLTETLTTKLRDINTGIDTFVKELKRQNLWDNVTLVTVSDFGRTLSSNGLGTDHAWGGNYFVLGGSVRGRQILGNFPERLTEDSELEIGRGRFIPTLGWESMWNAVIDWFGVPASQVDTVLPNAQNFRPMNKLLNKSQLFKFH